MSSRYVDVTTLHWRFITGDMGTWIFPLFHWKYGLVSSVRGLLGENCLERDLLFVPLILPHQVVWGALCIKAVIKGIWGAMGKFVVTKTVTHVILFAYPQTPTPPSELWLEQRISNDRFLLFPLLTSPTPPPHTHLTPSFSLNQTEEYPRIMEVWQDPLNSLGL